MVPSAPATARIDTAASPPESARTIAAAAISARLCSGRGPRAPRSGLRPDRYPVRGLVADGMQGLCRARRISLNCKQRSLLYEEDSMQLDRITSADGATVVLRSIGERAGHRDPARRRRRRTRLPPAGAGAVGPVHRAPLQPARPVGLGAAGRHGDRRRPISATSPRCWSTPAPAASSGTAAADSLRCRRVCSLPLDRIAVYDPGLSILGRPSFDFFERSRRPSRRVTTRAR